MVSNSKKKLAIIIGFRDWGLDRLALAIQSHMQCSIADKIDVIVSDYGSIDEASVKQVVEQCGARVVRTPRNGDWSRSRALNQGVLDSSAEFCITTDADMIFSYKCAEKILSLLEFDQKTVHLIQCRDLAPEFNAQTIKKINYDDLEENSYFRPRWGMGGLIAFPREVYDQIRGYDERMEVYGGEDIDFAQRLQRAGKRLNWIDEEEVRIYHIWHPSTSETVQKDQKQKLAQDYNRSIMLNDKTWIRNITLSKFMKKGRPLVSVAIATHNRADYLKEAINSVLVQTVQDFEIVILDDGSEDHTREVVESFSDERIRYYYQKASGVGVARNVLLDKVKAQYVVVHDDDDIMLPDRIENHFKSLDAGFIGTYGGWIDFSNNTGEIVVNQGREYEPETFIFGGRILTHGSSMFDVSILKKFKYREDLPAGVDFNLIARLANSGYKLKHTKHIHILRRMHEVNLTHTVQGPQRAAAVRATTIMRHAYSPEEETVLRNKAKMLKTIGCVNVHNADFFFKPYLPDSLSKKTILIEDIDVSMYHKIKEKGYKIHHLHEFTIVDCPTTNLNEDYIIEDIGWSDYVKIFQLTGAKTSLVPLEYNYSNEKPSLPITLDPYFQCKILDLLVSSNHLSWQEFSLVNITSVNPDRYKEYKSFNDILIVKFSDQYFEINVYILSSWSDLLEYETPDVNTGKSIHLVVGEPHGKNK